MIRKVEDSAAETMPEPNPEQDPEQDSEQDSEPDRTPAPEPAEDRLGDAGTESAPDRVSEGVQAGAAPLLLRDRLEAVLFASGEALTAARLSKVLGADSDAIKTALAELTESWAERTGSSGSPHGHLRRSVSSLYGSRVCCEGD